MKGTIVSAWVKTCRKLYGDSVTEDAMMAGGLDPKKLFMPTEDIEDSKPRKMVEYLSKKLEKTNYDLWREIGTDNILTFSKDYPAFFDHKNLYSFLKSMYDVHVVVTQKISGAKPPILGVKAIGKRIAEMTYKSSRGMFGYFQGMLEGSAKYYGEEIEVKTIEKTHDFIKLHITFPNEIYYHKKYRINKLLSFGFIKSLELKVAIASLILIGGPYVILSRILDGNILTITTLGLSLLVPYVMTKLLLLPRKNIVTTLNALIERTYSEEIVISTGDFFEDLLNQINEYKTVLKADFVGFKGMTDELNVFLDKFSEISTNMNNTSKEISSVVEQVAQGAVNQAEETESSAYLLNNNIKSLNEIADRENSSKEDLEATVEKINQGYEVINASAQSLEQVLGKFSQVKEESLLLQNRAKDVTKIVETVASIADQTNLLALNAAIEASRAGEYGRGFAVVAQEIRDLAEGSKEAVKSINENLVSFINEINSLVSQIEDQHAILEGENKQLSHVSESNLDTVTSIQRVAESLIEMINQLTNETRSINSVSENIESLAAIAEENSASSEEVSANIISYTHELEKMMENIKEFKKVSENFKTDLDEYKL